MRVTTILDNIDNGRMALPQFQRGYVWNGAQVRALMDSMYRRHPVGSLLAWNTEPDEEVVRSGQDLAPGARDDAVDVLGVDLRGEQQPERTTTVVAFGDLGERSPMVRGERARCRSKGARTG